MGRLRSIYFPKNYAPSPPSFPLYSLLTQESTSFLPIGKNLKREIKMESAFVREGSYRGWSLFWKTLKRNAKGAIKISGSLEDHEGKWEIREQDMAG